MPPVIEIKDMQTSKLSTALRLRKHNSMFLLERRRLTDSECPLLTRVNLGPHEDAAKIYVMDNRTTDIRHEVRNFLYYEQVVECRPFTCNLSLIHI